MKHRTDPATVVHGVTGSVYVCPDVTAVDREIAKLLRRISQCPARFPKTIDQFRDDVDLLLERRHDLSLLAAGMSA